MTFDDGPSKALTPKLLDLLAAHHIKATFFVIGENAADHPEILKRAVAEGHEIANHSWSHPNLGKMSDEAVRRELRKTDETISAAIGVRPTCSARLMVRSLHGRNIGSMMNLATG